MSTFDNKDNKPEENDLISVLGESYNQWLQIRDFVLEKYPAAIPEWNFSGKNYGWGFRLKDKKRVIVYMTPCEAYFKLSLVFGEKATNAALESDISEIIKKEISSAKVYAEGRGIRFEVKDGSMMDDFKQLIGIKLRY